MKRRDSILTTALFAGATVTGKAFADAQGGGSRFGGSIIPPAQEKGKEKHVPVIEAPASVKAGEAFNVNVTIGKTVPHPNTVAHHIEWIQLYAQEDGSKYVVELAKLDLGATYASPSLTVPVMLKKNSTLYALGYCNLHGVWDYSAKVTVG